jgi:2,5-furandicarboxylate decarboxylase 1
MSLRSYIEKIKSSQELLSINKPVSTKYQAAGILKKMEPRPILFENIQESEFPVVGNMFCSKSAVASYFGVTASEILPLLSSTIQKRTPPKIIENAPCQEVVIDHPDLNDLPILRHCERDGGNYISSGVLIARHPSFGQNMDFHRMMQISNMEMAVRVVKNRHFDVFLGELKEVDVAVCIGNAPNILLAAATSLDIGIDEIQIANALEPTDVVRAKTVDVLVPAEAEFVLEGTIYLDKLHAEGPFVDLTGTYDRVRQQPVFTLKAMTHRKDAVWQALLPGSLEHKLLMGMPREPTIYNKVNQVVTCLDVNISPGGCSWLHAIVQIDKKNEEDGVKAIQAAFEGHRSCKHVFVVDKDIDIYNPLEVEWALATRFQGDRGLMIKEKEQGSSLDPSAEPDNHLTTKLGFDLTKPLHADQSAFEKASFPDVDLASWIDEKQ